MSLRVFAWDANPIVDPFLYRQSENRGLELVTSERADFIILCDGRRAIQMRASKEEKAEKSVGRNNLIPFGRVFNKLIGPPSVSYEIPHAGDLGMRRHNWRRRANLIVSRTLKVSARKIDLTAAAYLTPTRTLSSPAGLTSSLISQF